MSENVTRPLGKHLAELFDLPFEKMRKIVVTVEAKTVPTVEVEYFILGDRATHIQSTFDEDEEDSPVPQKKKFRVTEEA